MTSIRSTSVGAQSRVDLRCDQRWTMAFSAVVGDRAVASYDTTSRSGCAVHPMFAVAAEWVLMTARTDPFGLGLSRDEEVAGIHVSHDVRVHRAWCSPADVSIVGEVAALREVRSGVFVTFRFHAHDCDGNALWTTSKGMIYLGTTLDGPAVSTSEPVHPKVGGAGTDVVELPWRADTGFAHVYTECARIWNPIHTDVSVARRAGLDGPILHGTATLARSVTEVVRHLGVEPSAIRAFGGQFRVMVPVPAALLVRAHITAGAAGSTVRFDTLDERGGHAVRGGHLELG